MDPASTYDCKFPGCTNTAKSPRGPYSYCDEHRGTVTNRTGATTRTGSVMSDDSFAGRVRRLASTARTLDTAKARYLKARAELDKAMAAYKSAAGRARAE